MAKFFEPLAGGVSDKSHPALLQEGSLVRALDAYYKPDDMGIWVAPARARCGQSTATGVPIENLVPLIWDPGTETAGELRQFGFVDPEFPTQLAVVIANASPGDAYWDFPAYYQLLDGGPASFGNHLDFVAYDNNYFLLPGKNENYFFRRKTDANETFPDLPYEPQFARHGMPANRVDIRLATGGATAATDVDSGFYQYWFTWYSSVLDVEGDRPDPEYIGTFGMVLTNANFIRNQVQILAGSPTWRLFARKVDFDNAKPPHADRIRIYRSIAFDQDILTSHSSPLGVPWPSGWLVAEVTINTLTTLNPAFEGEPYYVLFGDTFAIPSNLIDRYSSSTQPFPVATISGVQRGQNGPPPAASTGDVFEESLVLNDLEDPRKVWYSFPGFPHAFPDLHFINMDSKESDEVVALRTLGTRMFVGMRESIWKLNWLPLEGDDAQARGRAKDLVIEGKGVIGVSGVTRFTLPRLLYAPEGTVYGTMIAWASIDGVYATDLDNTIKLTRGIKWPVAEKVILLDNPSKERIECAIYTGQRYTSPGAPAGVPDCWYYIHYSDGKVRVTGPVRRPGGIYAAAYMSRPDGAYILSTDMDGKFAIESIGSSEPATGESPVLEVATRDIYPEGFMEETEIGRAVVHASGGGSLTAVLFLEGKRFSYQSRKSDSLLADPLIRWSVNKNCERVRFELEATGDVRINFVGGDDREQELGEVSA